MRIGELFDNLSEQDLQTKVVDRARILGWRVHHDQGDVRLSTAGDPGFPDLVLSRHGVTIYAELKRNKGRLTQTQCEWLGAITDTDPLEWRTGSITASRLGYTTEVYVWRPSDWPLIEEILR